MFEEKAPPGPGFRFGWLDAVSLLACIPLTWLLWLPLGPLALALPITLGHFFLFCNVIRIRRGFELIWSAFFMMNTGAWLLMGRLDWLWILALQTPLTAALVWWEVRNPNYLGVLWRRRKRSQSRSP